MERPVSLWEKMNSNCFHRLDVSNSEGSSSKPSPMAALFVPQNKGTGVALKQQQPPPPPPPPRCQVEGCNVDLSGVKAYYCKHKVCGMHSKSPKVIVAGMEQRFCQQCSRFHQLHEFDLGKRSCRKRLACHNERRRKPSLGNPGRMSSTVHGENSRFRGILVDFTRPKLSALPKESWQRGPLNDHAQNYENQSGSGIPSLVGDSNCVLSLLSTEPWENTNCSIDGAQVPTHVSETLSKNMANSWGLYSAIEGSQFAGELELIIEGKRHCMGLELSGRGRSCDGVFHWSPY